MYASICSAKMSHQDPGPAGRLAACHWPTSQASCHSSFVEEMLLECDVKKMEAGTTLGHTWPTPTVDDA